MNPEHIDRDLQAAILAIEELINHEIRHHSKDPSTVFKVDYYTQLIKELGLAIELADTRSKTFSIQKKALRKKRTVEDFRFIKLYSKSSLAHKLQIGGPNDANDPNEIRRISNSYLDELTVECDGLFGEKYRVNLNDHIGYRVYMNGFFDISLIGFILYIKRYLRRIELIDVGANIGSVSIPIASNGVKCISVEANPVIFHELIANISLNSIDNCCAINKAVVSQKVCLDKKEQLTLFMPQGNTGATSFTRDWNPSKGKNSNIEVKCQGDTIDNILEGVIKSRHIVIKIDIEGGELEALRGAEKMMNTFRPIIIIEWNQKLNKYNGKLGEILRLIPEFYEGVSLVSRHVKLRGNQNHINIRTELFDPEESYENVVLFDKTNPRLSKCIKNFDIMFSLETAEFKRTSPRQKR